ILRRSAKLKDAGDGAVVLEYLSDEITINGSAALLLRKMLPNMDGKSTLAEIAAQIHEPVDRLGSLTAKLSALGVLATTGPGAERETITGEQFYAIHRRYCAHWLRPVYDHPLWGKMVDGTATRAQVLGFAFEKYHYIEGAYEHMAIAAANATPEMMPHLARH